MIKIWTDRQEAGFLDRLNTRGTVFVYPPGTDSARAVSVTMPVRMPSYDRPFDITPIFEMSLPEGALREQLRLSFAKAEGSFDDYNLLSIVGRSQLGRIRYSALDQALDDDVPFQSVQEILDAGRSKELFKYVYERFAKYSGISGVQPKVLVRDETATIQRVSPSHKAATHIVKFWEADYPQLAANEYFCLKAAERSGLEVPRHQLAVDGSALVIDRFDIGEEGRFKGFEDFCVLNARGTAEKYKGSYETAILKRFQQFANSRMVMNDLEKLYALIVFNCAIRNGDAHLKNFAILYDDVQGEARLAPAYDLVTTTAYIPVDAMALTLNGSTHWPTVKELQRLGETRIGLTPARVRKIFERTAAAMADTANDIRNYMKEHPEFQEIGTRMLTIWDATQTR